MLAVGVEEQDRAEDARVRGRFDDSDQLGQRGLQRRIADRQLEHLVVRGSKRIVAPVLGDVVALDEDGGPLVFGRWQRLEDEVDDHFFGCSVGSRNSKRHAVADEGLAGAGHAVEDLVDSLLVEFRDRLEQRLAD